jgi:hypothetical protein
MQLLIVVLPCLLQIRELSDGASVAIISPYKAQVSLLRELFTQALGKERAKTVDINTIDGFQVSPTAVCSSEAKSGSIMERIQC